MKKMLLIVCLSVGLAGCATTGGTGGTTTLDDIVKQVRLYTAEACGFLPLASVVIDILKIEGSAADYVTISNEICNAVNTPSARRGVQPRVHGVAARGRFVRR